MPDTQRRIETNFLIFDLSKQGITKRPLNFFKKLIVILSANILFLNMLILNTRLRDDIVFVYNTPEFLIPLGFLIFMAGLCVIMFYGTIIPGKGFSKVYRFINFIFYSIWAILILVGFYEIFVSIQKQELIFHKFFDLGYLREFVLMSLFSFMILLYFVLRGFSIRLYKLATILVPTTFVFPSILDLFKYPQNFGFDSFIKNFVLIIPGIILMTIVIKIYFKFNENPKSIYSLYRLNSSS